MWELKAKLIVETESKQRCRRFRHNQVIADILEEVDLDAERYLIVEDDRGDILGIVEVEEILSKLSAFNPTERQRWRELPLESAIGARLDGVAPARKCTSKMPDGYAEYYAKALSTSGDDLTGIFLQDELYLRWSSIDQILRHALVDSVTELPNRMVFERRLSEEWERMDREQNSVCVMLIDLDNFKSINDQYGHCVGDRVLQKVAGALKSSLRSYDLVVRYGGDEFAAILSNCDTSQLSIPIQRIQDGLQEIYRDAPGSIPEVTLSIGAATIDSQAEKPTICEFIDLVDSCLYAAKNQGRDCAYIADYAHSNRQPQLWNADAPSCGTR